MWHPAADITPLAGIDLTILNTGGGLEYHGHAPASTFPKTKAYIARAVHLGRASRRGISRLNEPHTGHDEEAFYKVILPTLRPGPKTRAYIARTVRKHEVKRMGSRQTFDK